MALIVQPAVNPIDEYGALIYAGRWGIHGITLPGRVTFAPGNVGFSTFGAPRPMEVSRKVLLYRVLDKNRLFFFFKLVENQTNAQTSESEPCWHTNLQCCSYYATVIDYDINLKKFPTWHRCTTLGISLLFKLFW